MKLALRSKPPSDARWYEVAFNWLVKWRLVSRYSHSGIVIDSRLYQVNARHGLHVSDYTPDSWDVFDVGGNDAKALALFALHQGAGYDYLGVLGFGLPMPRSGKRFYCFSWCALAMGMPWRRWMTPERLLRECLLRTTGDTR